MMFPCGGALHRSPRAAVLLRLEGTATSSPAASHPLHQAGKPSLADVCLALSLNISGESNSTASLSSLFHV